MRASELAAALEEPDLHRQLLGGYNGPYALGITKSPDTDEPVLLLRVGGDAPPNMLESVEVNGEQIPVIIEKGFVSPKAQNGCSND
jgi:hypothetical protein